MGRLSRVAWSEGMFLRQQHFQQQDRFIEALIDARLVPLGSYGWGLVSFKIDESLAALGKFSLERCVAILPDGSVASFPAEQAPPEPLDIPDGVRDAIVSLTLPADRLGAVEFARQNAGGAGPARFRVDEEEVLDRFSDQRVAETLELGWPNLSYGYTPEQTYGRVCIGIARVREVSGRRVVFDERYIPPSLAVSASVRLTAYLEDVLGRADQRVEELAERASDASDGRAETLANFFVLQALNRWTPLLRHYSTLPTVHPETLFGTLASMAGELSTFVREERKPTVMPAYDHEALQTCFEPVIGALRDGLSGRFDRSAEQLPLKPVGGGGYATTIVDRSLFQTGHFYLAVKAAAPVEELRMGFPSKLKIGAITRMQKIVDNALPGIPVHSVAAPPPQIRILPGYVYFELDRNSPEWADFATAPGVGIYVAAEPADLKLELWCVKSGAK
jgi:type VI secretion system protein ImpJ